PWLRARAAGRATIVTDLAHMADVPSLDPRTWMPRPSALAHRPSASVSIAVDILDEDHSLRPSMRRLGVDARVRPPHGNARRGRTQHHRGQARPLRHDANLRRG